MSPFTSYALFVVFGSTAIIFQGCDSDKRGNVFKELRQQLTAGKKVTTTGATATTTSNAPTNTTAATTTTTTTTPSLIDVIVQLILNQLNVEDVDLVNQLKQQLKLEQQLKLVIEQYEVDDDDVKNRLQLGINELQKLVDIADKQQLVKQKAALDSLGLLAYGLKKTLYNELKQIQLVVEVDWNAIASIIVDLVQQLKPQQLQKIFTGIEHVVVVGTWILSSPRAVDENDKLKQLKQQLVDKLQQLKRAKEEATTTAASTTATTTTASGTGRRSL